MNASTATTTFLSEAELTELGVKAFEGLGLKHQDAAHVLGVLLRQAQALKGFDAQGG